MAWTRKEPCARRSPLDFARRAGREWRVVRTRLLVLLLALLALTALYHHKEREAETCTVVKGVLLLSFHSTENVHSAAFLSEELPAYPPNGAALTAGVEMILIVKEGMNLIAWDMPHGLQPHMAAKQVPGSTGWPAGAYPNELHMTK